MQIKSKNIKVMVAMSGGVDSSVAAALLKSRGFDLVGVFMKFWQAPGEQAGEGWNRCCSAEAAQRARAVAQKLGIPFYVLNVEREFKKAVVDYFLKEYKAGKTPNPCVVCNKEIKFRVLLRKALELEADYVATGHYARLASSCEARREIRNPNNEIRKKSQTTVFKLLKAKDKNKDQTYFLWQLEQRELAKVLFPIGEYTKPKVRQMAKMFDLPTAKIRESQEVCFIKDGTCQFLLDHLKTKKGKITDKSGQTLGQHQGLWFYTIGQRKGIRLSGGPYFVIAKDRKNNVLIVSKNEKDLFKKELIAKDVNWISGQEPALPLRVKARVRYRSRLAVAVIQTKLGPRKYKLVFTESQRAVTPGQSVVFYLPAVARGAKAREGNELLGGGIIV